MVTIKTFRRKTILAGRDGQLAGFRLQPLYIQEYFSVTITMYDPYMPNELMEAYLKLKCAVVKGGVVEAVPQLRVLVREETLRCEAKVGPLQPR